MGIETWYRGEGAGVPPAKPGGHLHDLGDGMYLSDTEDVAWQYAKTRANKQASDYRVLEVTIDRQSLGRVLDLTTDPRWSKFMREPMVPGSKNPALMKSRWDYVRGQNELYGQFFKEFCRANSIDLRSYDAVIGPEYVRGGKQMVILHHDGQPTKLSLRIRALLRPNAWAARLAKVSTSSGNVSAGNSPAPRASFPRAVGGLVVGLGISLFLAWVSAKLMQKINDSIIKQRMKEFEPEIQRFADAFRMHMLQLISYGSPAYVTVSIEIRYLNVPNTANTHDVTYFQSPASVHLTDLSSTSRDLTSTVTRSMDASFFGGGTWSDVYTFTFSSEAKFSKEELERYNDAIQHRDWCEKTLDNKALPESDREKVLKEYHALVSWFGDTFGNADFRPNRALWTRDGYAAMLRTLGTAEE
jgi:hypothetical protein